MMAEKVDLTDLAKKNIGKVVLAAMLGSTGLSVGGFMTAYEQLDIGGHIAAGSACRERLGFVVERALTMEQECKLEAARCRALNLKLLRDASDGKFDLTEEQ
jgi:hypothetical protein